jgi:site-specific recombinase XerD
VVSLEAFALWLGKVHVVHSPEAVTREQLTDFIAHLKQVGFAAASIKINTVALKILFRWLSVRERIPVDPADLLRLPV